ncbi:MAG: exodeoxyribonuclease VII large subunit [Clostridia bacterium]
MYCDYRLKNLLIKGEISNLKIHPSGHIYFSLKDTTSSFKAVMFESSAKNLNFKPHNGMDVICQGYVDIFERDGTLQLYCTDILPSGFGSAALALAQLKQTLTNEGLFDEKYKKPIPYLPKRIGIISGDESAAFTDILNVLNTGYPICQVIFFPVPVQGENADKYIAFATEFLDKNNLCDVIICSRGGGSNEDFSAFNSEIVARYVFSCKTPFISAVGHEIDTTLIDYVADFRAQTPTAAAAIFSNNLENYKKDLSFNKKRLIQLYYNIILEKNNDLLLKKNNTVFLSYENILEKATVVNDIKKMSLFETFSNNINLEISKNHLNKSFFETFFNNKLQNYEKIICDKKIALKNLTNNKIAVSSFEIKNKIDRLNDLSPLNILKRGYCISFLSDKNNKTISIEKIKTGDEFTVFSNSKEITAIAKNVKEKI